MGRHLVHIFSFNGRHESLSFSVLMIKMSASSPWHILKFESELPVYLFIDSGRTFVPARGRCFCVFGVFARRSPQIPVNLSPVSCWTVSALSIPNKLPRNKLVTLLKLP